MVYYVFDKFESSIGNALLRLNTSRSMALSFPAVPGKYYEMSFGRSIAAFDVNRSSDVGTFFQSVEEGAGFNIDIDLSQLNTPESMAKSFPNRQKEIIMKRVS